MIVTKFITQSIKSESISQYQIRGPEIIKELLTFARNFGNSIKEDEDLIIDSDDEGQATGGLVERVELTMSAPSTPQEQAELLVEIERMVKMFYLEMRVKGKLTEFKNDYF